jgi:hypothetical protein
MSQELLEYMEEIGIDLIIDKRNMFIHVINERNESFEARNLGSVIEIKRGMEKMDVFRFGILMDVYHSVRQYIPITNDKIYIRTIRNQVEQYKEKIRIYMSKEYSISAGKPYVQELSNLTPVDWKKYFQIKKKG